tara:strand:- start:3995 stop:5872 length:1878 start_codon:yes stop_codon:yes gene_type:complete
MVLQTAIEGLNATVGKAIGRIENAIAISDQAQKASLALGQSLAGGSRTLDNSIRDLKGSFGNTLQAQLVALNSGLQGNVAGIGKLINQQQLTGGNFKATARSLATFELALGLTKDQLNSLAVATIETGKKYGVSTDKLIASIDSFSENFAALELAGMGDGFINAATEISAKVGPAVDKQLGSVFRFLTDPSVEALAKKSALGLGNFMENLGPNASPAALEAGLARAAQHIENMAGDTSKFFTGMGIVEKRFGKVASDIVIVNRALNKRQEIEARNQGEFFDQISVLKNQILAPLDKLFSDELFPKVKEFVDLLGRIAKPIIEKIETGLRDFLTSPQAAMGNFIGTIDTIQTTFTKVINGVITGLNFFSEAMVRFVDELNDIWGIEIEPAAMAALRDEVKEGSTLQTQSQRRLDSLREQAIYIKDPEAFNAEFNGQKMGTGSVMQGTADIRRTLPTIDKDIRESIEKGIRDGTFTEAQRKEKTLEILAQSMQAEKENFRNISKNLAENTGTLDNFWDNTVDALKIPLLELKDNRAKTAYEEMLGDIASNTADTAENTKNEDNLADSLPFMLDQSIISLGDALLAITRRAVEEPDPLQEAMLSELQSQSRSLASPGRTLMPGRAKLQ